MENERWNVEVARLVEHYKMMESVVPDSSMLREVKRQYTDMSSGGHGGDLGFVENGTSTCRGVNYPDYPDWVFQRVMENMGWQREN